MNQISVARLHNNWREQLCNNNNSKFTVNIISYQQWWRQRQQRIHVLLTFVVPLCRFFCFVLFHFSVRRKRCSAHFQLYCCEFSANFNFPCALYKCAVPLAMRSNHLIALKSKESEKTAATLASKDFYQFNFYLQTISFEWRQNSQSSYSGNKILSNELCISICFLPLIIFTLKHYKTSIFYQLPHCLCGKLLISGFGNLFELL